MADKKKAIDLNKLDDLLNHGLFTDEFGYKETFEEFANGTECYTLDEAISSILFGAISLYAAYRRMVDDVSLDGLKVELKRGFSVDCIPLEIDVSEDAKSKGTELARFVCREPDETKRGKSQGMRVKVKKFKRK